MSLGQPEGAADSSAGVSGLLPVDEKSLVFYGARKDSRSVTDSRSWISSRFSTTAILLVFYLFPVLFYVFLAFIRKPGVPVVWDSIYYKNLFLALTRDPCFDLRHCFPVSPLYPLCLVPTAVVQGYLLLAQIQVALGSVYYFLGIYPLYRLGCRLGGPRTGFLTALLFVVYPSSLYSAWIMSEAVSVPVFLFALWLACEVMLKATIWNTLGLGVVAGLLPLSRPQGIFLALLILVLIPLMGNRGSRQWRAPLYAAVLGVLLALAVWISLGYINHDGATLAYYETTGAKSSLLSSVSRTLFLSAVHACGLWLEGGLLILPLGLVGGWWLSHSRLRGAIACLCLSAAAVILLSVAFHVARFMNGHSLQPILRYAFYCNLALLPFAAWLLLHMRLIPHLTQRLLIISTVSMSAVLFWPHVWKEMRNLDNYFSNAPALQIYTRLEDWPTAAVWALVTGIALSAITFMVRKPQVGIIVTLVLLGVVTRHAVEQYTHMQKRLLKHYGREGVHALCERLERKEWGDTPVVCQYDPYVDFLGREISFLVQTNPVWQAHEYNGHRPYLFVTFKHIPNEQLVMNSGGLRAYLMTGPDNGPPPANYTPGPPPWY